LPFKNQKRLFMKKVVCRQCKKEVEKLVPLDLYDALDKKGICQQCYDDFRTGFKKMMTPTKSP